MGLNEFGQIANIERAYLDRTRIKVRVGLLKLYLTGFNYTIINTFKMLARGVFLAYIFLAHLMGEFGLYSFN